MTGGHDVGDLFCGTEDAWVPARWSERAVTWMALPPCSNETDTVLPPRYAICARRPTSAIFCKIEAEHWPTSIYRPSSGICEPAVVPGRREEGVITTPRSAPSATATISCRSVFVDAA